MSPMRLRKVIFPSALLLLTGATIALTSGCGPVGAIHQEDVQKRPSDPFLILISFGHGESLQQRWTGSFAALSDVQISEAKGWLFKSYDRLSVNRFDVRTVDAERENSELKGILLRGSSDSTGQITVETNSGSFLISVSDLEVEKELEFLDARVRVRGMRQVEKLTDNSRDDDYPSIAVRDESTAYAVWQSYSGLADEIRFRKYDKVWRTVSRVPGVSGDVWRPQIALDREHRPWVVWSQQVEGNFDLYARALDEEKDIWLETVRLSRHPNPDIDHHLISDARGNLWVVWQGFHGNNSDIFLRHFDGCEWSPEVQITSHPSNDWEPRIGVDSRGKAHIVWDSYRNGNYDVYMRSWETGSMGPLVRVAGTPRFEAHASVVVDREDRVWVAWDEAAVNWAKDTGPTDDPGWLERGQEVFSTWIDQPASPGARIYSTRRVQIAVFEGNQRESTVQALDAALADAGIYDHDYPQLFLDPASGHIALLFHRWGQFDKVQSLGLKWAFWEHAVTFYEGDRWSRPYTLLESWGRPSMRSHGAYGPDGTLWLVWPTDERNYQPQLERQGTTFSQPAGNPVMNVHAGRIRSDKSPSRLELATWQEPDPIAYDPVHPEEADQVQKIRSYRAVIESREHRILRGDLHRHTEFSWDSRGGNVDGSVFDYYRYMLDAGAMDFGGITDHNSGGDWEYAWWLIEKSSDLFHIPRAFTTFYAYERSVQWPDGHRNVFHTRRGVPVVSYFTRPDFQYPRPGIGAQSKDVMEADIPLLYESLHRTGGLSIPHTTGSNMGTNWRYHDPEVEPVVEIFQGARISYEHAGAPRAPRGAEDDPLGGWQETGTLWSAYRKGYRIGTIASSDHWSTHISYAMVYTEDATREGIFEAIKKRHTYGATDNIVLDVRMGDHFMGDDFTASELPALRIRVQGTSPVTQLEIIKNEKIIYSANPNRRDVRLTFQDQEPVPGTSYYYVRAVQDDGEMVWGSPIWVTLTN